MLAFLSPVPARAQVRQPEDTISAGEGAGVLSDVSRPLGDDSTSVHTDMGTIGEASNGPVHSGPVRDGATRGMLSGPVSEVSRGPVREPAPSLSAGAVAEGSAGAVKLDIDSPLGERISQPLRELGPLQQEMRQQRERAEQAALSAATAPAEARADVTATGNELVVPPYAAAPQQPVEPDTEGANQADIAPAEDVEHTGPGHAGDETLPVEADGLPESQ